MERVYEDLANAIIEQAVTDWKNADKAIRKLKNAKNQEQVEKRERAERRKAECEDFFLGDWITKLSSIDGEALLRDLQKEAEALNRYERARMVL